MKFNITEIAYELYKEDWVSTHTTKEQRVSCMRDYFEEMVADDNIMTFDDWLWDHGYNGSLYVCYEEFGCAEYQSISYMSYLLGDGELWDMYVEDTHIQ